MKQHEISALFAQMADLLEFRGENVFRIRAYRRAAQNLESVTEDLERLNEQDRLEGIPGIGHDLAQKIRDYLLHGTIKDIEQLKRAVPPVVFELLEVPGVGPKTAKLLVERLRIGSLDQLEAAAKAHKVCKLSGFQETKEQNILKGIAIVRKGRARMHLGLAVPLARHIMDVLRALPEVKRMEQAGSLRRMQETIGDLDLLVGATKPAAVMRAFTTAAFCSRVLAAGDTKSSILTPDGVQVDLRVVEPNCFGAALQYFTGSKEHNIHLREMAARKGLKVNEYGVFNLKTDKRLAGREEEDVYRALGLPWIPPEIREDRGELEAAREGRLPTLVTQDDLRGDFHIHTTSSDGAHSLEEVAEAGRRRGYEFLVISDHSQSLKVANGMSPRELKAQMAKIGAMNRRFRKFQLLMGSEVDILERGRLDYPDALLSQLDFVIGSIHSGFKQDEATLTNRLTRAMDNPYLSMIAHPTGRLMGQRDPYAVNLETVFAAASATHTALEINAYPKRLDLNDQHARRAKDLGVRLAISTDTHSLDQLNDITIGLGVARRAWLEPTHLLNCLSRNQLLAWVHEKRRRAR